MEAFLKLHKTEQNQGYRPSNKVAVMVEPRGKHPYLELVIRNALKAFDNSWAFQIWTYEGHVSYVRDLFPDMSTRLEIKPLPLDSISIDIYNVLLMSPYFWENIGEQYEHILIFQTDCIFFQKWNNDWFEYDYVGANYYNSNDTAPIIGGIQGGLSYRKKSVMLECIRNISIKDANTYRVHMNCAPIEYYNEDVYFTHACEILNKKVPSCHERPKFSIEADFYERPFGHHGWNKPYFHPNQLERLFRCAFTSHTEMTNRSFYNGGEFVSNTKI